MRITLKRPTVLPDIHADGVRRGDVGVGRLHGCASIPHVEEEENGDRREAEDGQEGQGQDVGQEHELRRGIKDEMFNRNPKPTDTCLEFVCLN